ncbi:hypothetical protein FOZ63_002380 [Perkinsus olseni]|uniref:Uncharacterized protein n=1 Tax=Perkinsus olseni TaxID=32597 RepID=A0A7J6N7Z7_PEROL|nr:hypothetical protein FOZ63_002380 [Perkinsus olseni]
MLLPMVVTVTTPSLSDGVFLYDALCRCLDDADSLSIEELAWVIRRRLYIVLNTTESFRVGEGLASFLKNWVRGFPPGSYDAEELNRLFPSAVWNGYVKDQWTLYRQHKLLSGTLGSLQFVSDYVFSSLLVQQSRYWKGDKKTYLSVANSTWSVLFDLLCDPHCSHSSRTEDSSPIFSVDPGMYNQYKEESNDVHRGNYMEGLVSLVMAQLGDMSSVLLSVILALRIKHENRQVLRDIRQNIAYCRQHNYELNILKDPAEDSDTFAKWQEEWLDASSVLVHLFEIGELSPKHSYWMRWFNRSFHSTAPTHVAEA